MGLERVTGSPVTACYIDAEDSIHGQYNASTTTCSFQDYGFPSVATYVREQY
jgi:hypothetical protein